MSPMQVAPAPESAAPHVTWPQIDTLRAIAVATVMFEHYLPWQFHKIGLMDGVLLFFTISGFLITGILLGYKGKVEAGATSTKSAFLTFYARRSLRIFPAYYALLFIMLLTGALWENNFFWHLFYATNFWTAVHQQWDSAAGHFWTLAVEEQFYLIWPLVLLLAPRRALPWVMIAGFLSAIAFRIASIAFGWGLAITVIPIACFDALLGGALLAWAHANNWTRVLGALRKWGVWVLPLGLAFIVTPEWFNSVLSPTWMALASIYLIDQCVMGYKGWLGWAMSRPWIMYFGKISYGIYLYHYAIRAYIPSEWFESLPAGMYVRALVWSAATLALAVISWHVLEAPLNKLKDRFKLQPRSVDANMLPAGR